MPLMRAAPGPPVAVCRDCLMAVRFLPGHAPVLRGWRDSTCPSCQAEQSRDRAAEMTPDEQHAAIFDELRRDPEATVQDLIRRTGSAGTLVRGARRKAVTAGIAKPIAAPAAAPAPPRKKPDRPKPKPDRPTRKRRPPGATEQQVRDAISADPGSPVVALAGALGVSTNTVRRRLRVLVESGEVEASRAGKGPAPVTYRIARDAG